jgi:hypothetical protein
VIERPVIVAFLKPKWEKELDENGFRMSHDSINNVAIEKDVYPMF